jgi:hypothetical protein
MMTTIVDIVLLAALVLTSLRVASMHRELRRLRSYQTQYVELFGETNRAADTIGAALNHIGNEGREVLERLEAAIGQGSVLSARLEAMAKAATPKPREAADDEAGTYSRQEAVRQLAASGQGSRNEILKFTADSRFPEGRRADTDTGASSQRAGRDIRLAPSVRTLEAAGGRR